MKRFNRTYSTTANSHSVLLRDSRWTCNCNLFFLFIYCFFIEMILLPIETRAVGSVCLFCFLSLFYSSVFICVIVFWIALRRGDGEHNTEFHLYTFFFFFSAVPHFTFHVYSIRNSSEAVWRNLLLLYLITLSDTWFHIMPLWNVISVLLFRLFLENFIAQL